jgi:Flp pilus assembly protein TadG
MNAKGKKGKRGAALVEFALGWSFLWLLFAGVWEFGYSFYIYNALLTAVSGAAELGAKMDYDTANPSAFTTALQNMVVYGDETAGATPIVPGLSTSNVNVSVTLDAQSMPRAVTVNIQNYTINSIFQSFSPTNKPRATTKFYGQISCSTC